MANTYVKIASVTAGAGGHGGEPLGRGRGQVRRSHEAEANGGPSASLQGERTSPDLSRIDGDSGDGPNLAGMEPGYSRRGCVSVLFLR